MADPSWANVLVLQTSFLGDTVLTLPLIDEIRRQFPVKRLTLLCQPASRELLHDHPGIDEIIVDDKKKTDRGFARQSQGSASSGLHCCTHAAQISAQRPHVVLGEDSVPCRFSTKQKLVSFS